MEEVKRVARKLNVRLDEMGELRASLEELLVAVQKLPDSYYCQ